jgi:hypothetical protein
VVGDVQLAPTTELAGLAELASLPSPDDELDALARIAEMIRAEDDARAAIARLHSSDELAPLPNRLLARRSISAQHPSPDLEALVP